MISSTPEVREEKKRIRAKMLNQRNAMSAQDRVMYSNDICNKLWELIQENNAGVIHSFLTMGSEVIILPFLQKCLNQGLTVVVPKTLPKRQIQNLVLHELKNMEPGIFNTYHPKNALEYQGRYDLIIVAGLAFDEPGFRVGYGGGYYDTFLAGQPGAVKAGVCFPFQLINKVPVEPHDVRMDQVIW